MHTEALDHDVAGQFAEAQLAEPGPEQAHHDQHRPQGNQPAQHASGKFARARRGTEQQDIGRA